MTPVGCFLSVSLFVLLCCYGTLRAAANGASLWRGLAFALGAWFAAVCGYAAVLSVIDLFRYRRHPDLEGVPWWAIAIVWLLFATSVPATVALFRAMG